VKQQRKKLVHYNRRAPEMDAPILSSPAEKSAAFIDFRVVTNLGTKVLADMLTIDEIFRRCSNPKVERLETEVYG
jgi:hypothetical protein